MLCALQAWNVEQVCELLIRSFLENGVKTVKIQNKRMCRAVIVGKKHHCRVVCGCLLY